MKDNKSFSLGIFALIVFLSISSTSKPVWAQSSEVPPVETPYRSGKERYEKRAQGEFVNLGGNIVNVGKSLADVTGQFLEVPLDYDDPARGSFDMFYRLSPHFDPLKPTVIFFNGGPGGSSDADNFEKKLTQFNFIYFDQRGTSFSYLRNFKDLQDPRNFSSELIARDADFLRNALRIEQVSVWGHSYGTAVATIYAHLFASHVRALVLEGVIFDGTPDLWRAPFRLKLIQNYYDQLSASSKARIQQITDSGQVPADWFSQFVRIFMYSPHFEDLVSPQLAEILSLNVAEAVKKINMLSDSSLLKVDTILFGASMFKQISCQELSYADPLSGWGAVLKEGRLQAVGDPLNRQLCLDIPGMDKRLKRTYFSTDYPITVPVTYFEGTTDGATAPPNAMKHLKYAALGKAQLIYAVNEGHMPLQECLSSFDSSESSESLPCVNKDAVAEAATQALLGQNITTDLLKRLSVASRWMKASKLRPIIPQR